jgi:hypothetical protein
MAALVAKVPAGGAARRDWTRVVYEDVAGKRPRQNRCPGFGRQVTATLVRVIYVGSGETVHAAH